MSNATVLRGLCPAPFYDASKFDLGGFVEGRFCEQISQGVYCCLPCPMTDYLYPQDFNTWYRVAEGLNVAGLGLLVFLLLSFIILPSSKTRRHYLSYCLVLAAIMMELGFTIPFASQPEQCYDAITPNDMYTSLTCAFSGAFLISGGLSMATWIFIRALSMHLQICWDVTPGKQFFYWAQGLGWSVAAVFFTITITITGVSYRFGDVCHVNATHSMSDFWGPLLAIAVSAMLIQIATFVYCAKIYMSQLSEDRTETQSSAGLPYSTSVRTRSARAIYQRVRSVVYLQWRGIAIVTIILIDVVFFAVVFIWLNALTSHAKENVDDLAPYLLCLMSNPSNPAPCFSLGQELAVNEATVIAVLMMLSVAGFQVFLLIARGSLFVAWYELFRNRFTKNRDFVSLDAKHSAQNPHNFELKHVHTSITRSPDGGISPPPNVAGYHLRSDTPDYFSKETQREYRSPTGSFSTPKPLSRTMTQVEWDPKSSHAKGGLGFHPPEYALDAKM